jgi:hypothetical protein
MPDWTDLAAILARSEYNVPKPDRDDRITEPLDAPPCRCESPGFTLCRDDDEVRCWKCGARPATAAACRA